MHKQAQNEVKKLKKDQSFLVTVTSFSKKEPDKLNTHVYSNNFPYEEFDGTKEMIGQLIDEQKKLQFKKK